MFYYLEELDGIHIVKSIAGNQLKKFISRSSLDEGRERLHDFVCVREDQEEDERRHDEEEEVTERRDADDNFECEVE